MREPIVTLTSRTVVLPQANIDTDQIIPARFLTTTSSKGLGEGLFADWNKDPTFALNGPEAAGAQVLVAGDNFGCGSSREHAPWALLDYGFRAVVSCSIADIFKGNALKNGLLPVVVDASTHAALLAAPGATVTIDVRAGTLRFGERTASFNLDPFARHCLVQGVDELGYLLAAEAEIAAFEARRLAGGAP